ncbi:MAG TPA: hypothetical protein VH116_06655 [Gemmatimonadales bacterium]|jgi:hypothetical protein|nr:hypothetical protein [Gemmatimonadales bacterium]
MPKQVFLATRNLVFRAKLAAVVAAAGAQVAPDDAACDTAVVDAESGGAAERIRSWTARGVGVLAYGSHLQADLLRAARDAGAIAVPNSQVERRLRELLTAKT